jgi:hypothetical protein
MLLPAELSIADGRSPIGWDPPISDGGRFQSHRKPITRTRFDMPPTPTIPHQPGQSFERPDYSRPFPVDLSFEFPT